MREAAFGPDKKAGNVSDVLLDHTGRATAVVIGVGGFVGIGGKDVAVPFDQVVFTQEPLNPPQAAGAPSGAAAPASADPAAAMAGTGVVGTTAMGASPMEAAGASIRSDAYPDHGTIALTADQLKTAPTFKFAQ